MCITCDTHIFRYTPYQTIHYTGISISRCDPVWEAGGGPPPVRSAMKRLAAIRDHVLAAAPLASDVEPTRH